MQRVAIADYEDARLADFQNLKDATLSRQRGRFIVEGRGNLEVLLARSPHRPVSILLSQSAERALAPRLDRFAPACPVYVAPQPVLDRVVGFPIHRGCLAACSRGEGEDPARLAARVLAREPSPRLLVLEGVLNHDNVGGLFRNAMALGARGVVLCPRSADPLYRKAIRTSMGGALCVPFARARRWPETLDTLRALGFEIVALDPGADATALRRDDPVSSRPIALVVGSEGPGLTQDARARADRRIRVAMEPGVDSLNVAVAAGIALHSLRRETA